MLRFIIFILIFAQLLFSNEAYEIIKKLDENMRGKNISMKLSMRIVSLRYERTMKMQTYSQGTKKSFTKKIVYKIVF